MSTHRRAMHGAELAARLEELRASASRDGCRVLEKYVECMRALCSCELPGMVERALLNTSVLKHNALRDVYATASLALRECGGGDLPIDPPVAMSLDDALVDLRKCRTEVDRLYALDEQASAVAAWPAPVEEGK